MTRKDYIAVAKCIADRIESPATTRAAHEQLSTLAQDLCQVFKAENPRFDAQRFRFACALGD